MKKRILAAICAAMLALALPVTALAAPSPSGNTASATDNQGVTATVVSNGGVVDVEPTSEIASNYTEVAGYEIVANFKYVANGATGPFTFSYNLGAAYAGADVTVYVDHEGAAENEVINRKADANGTISFTTQTLSIHTITAKKASAAAGATNADKGAKSPQTGLNTPVVAAGTLVAVVAAAGVAVALRKDA